MSAGVVLPGEDHTEVDVPSRLPAPGAEPGTGTPVRRSLPLSGSAAEGVRGVGADALLLAATLVLARKYCDSVAFRIGVRWADQRPDAVAAEPLTVEMPARLSLAAHLTAVAARLADGTTAPAAATDSPPRLVCVLGGAARGGEQAELVVSAEVTAAAVTLHADCQDDAAVVAFTDRLLHHLALLLDTCVARPDTRVGGVQLLSDAERAQLRQLNDTGRQYPRDRSIYSLFAEQAAARPEAPAVVGDSGVLSYAALEEQAAGLSALLYDRGVRAGGRVALRLEKSPRLLAAVLAVLRLGAAYVPLDPAIPARRRDFLLADSAVDLLLTDDPELTARVPVLRLPEPGGPADALTPPTAADTSPLDPAYVMYTSGSTGNPKGVLVNQRAVIRLVRGTDFVELSARTRILQTGSLAFDATTFEFWGALLNGGTLVLVPGDTVLNAASLGAALTRHRVNTLFLTTALFHQLVEQDAAVLAGCQVLVGGEALSPAHLNKAVAACPDSVFANVYGPTENTTFSVTHRITRSCPADRVPIGRPIANSTAYVVDQDGNPQPPGIPGELWLGGDGLSDGYLNRPEENTRAFVRGGPDGDARLYRTGDRARWTADGLVEFLGRADRQVKVRGFRVELAEVERQLAALPSVREAVVLLRERADGLPMLCGYFTADSEVPHTELHAELLDELPAYMVPTAYLQVPRLPLNRNHKVDKTALAVLEPVVRAESAAPGRAPRTPEERAVARIFAEVLGVDTVSLDTDFFELGGNSLLAMRLWSRLRAVLEVEFELRQVLDTPTVAGLVQALEQQPTPAVARPKLVRRTP